MPFRDGRHGLRATVFRKGVVLEPLFEKGILPARRPQVSRVATILLRWWETFFPGFEPDDGADRDDVSFQARVATQVKASAEGPSVSAESPVCAIDIPSDAPRTQSPIEITATFPEQRERIVPITRRRLRPRAAAASHDERLNMLRNVLRTGSDAERALAIDGLSRHGLRDELAAALEDPLESLAAKAALAFAATTNRQRLTAAIRPHVCEGRLAAILALLPALDD